jgi:hypothetical protein
MGTASTRTMPRRRVAGGRGLIGVALLLALVTLSSLAIMCTAQDDPMEAISGAADEATAAAVDDDATAAPAAAAEDTADAAAADDVVVEEGGASEGGDDDAASTTPTGMSTVAGGAKSRRKTRAALGGKASTLPRLTEDGLHVAERNAAAHTEGSGDGDDADGGDRARYTRLAAYYHAQRRSIASFTSRDDVSQTGKCAGEIAALCTPSDMNQKFLKRLQAKAAANTQSSSSASSSEASATATATATATARRRLARALLADDGLGEGDGMPYRPGGGGSTVGYSDDEGSEDKKRIADLEAKVNILAAAVKDSSSAAGANSNSNSDGNNGNGTSAAAAAAAAAAGAGAPPKRHRPYRSYFECVHWNILEQRSHGISFKERAMNPAGLYTLHSVDP